MIKSGWLIHAVSSSGHRSVWIRLFENILNANYEIASLKKINNLFKLFNAEKLFILTIDDDYFLYSLLGVIRSIFKKRTVALMCAPERFFVNIYNLKSVLKRLIFKLNLYFEFFEIFTIVPHSYDYRYKEISKDWIYDPHLWNLRVTNKLEIKSTKLSESILKRKKNKKIIIYIGKSSSHKGFNEFIEFVRNNKRKYIGVVGGILTTEYNYVRRYKNFILVNRFINDDELVSLYKIADLIWCRYAENYNQSSGIFGYAIQTGCNVIFRENSTISKLYNEISTQNLRKFVCNARKMAIKKIKNENQ